MNQTTHIYVYKIECDVLTTISENTDNSALICNGNLSNQYIFLHFVLDMHQIQIHDTNGRDILIFRIETSVYIIFKCIHYRCSFILIMIHIPDTTCTLKKILV